MPELSEARYGMATATNSEGAWFIGGHTGQEPIDESDKVDIYDASLTQKKRDLRYNRCEAAAAVAGDTVLVAGGITHYEVDEGFLFASQSVEAYSQSEGWKAATGLPTGRYRLAGASAGDYALFAGGCTDDYYVMNNLVKEVTAYNESLTRKSATALSEAVYYPFGASVDKYALFAGGRKNVTGGANSASTKVNAYSSSLTKSNPADLTGGGSTSTAASTGTYATFVNRVDGSIPSTYVINAYDQSLTRVTATLAGVDGIYWERTLASACAGEYLIIAGVNHEDTSCGKTTAEIYDSAFTWIGSKNIAMKEISFLSGATAGDNAVFAGGHDGYAGNNSEYVYADVNAFTPELKHYRAGNAAYYPLEFLV